MSNAQITINQNDFASVGVTITLTDDTLPNPLLDLGTPGTDKTWDFTMLNNTGMYQYFFQDVANTPFAASFPNANLAIDIVGTGFFFYLHKSPTALNAVGQAGDLLGTGNDIALLLNPYDKIIEFPSTYLSAYNSTMSYDQTIYYNQNVQGFQVDSIRMKSIEEKTSVVDAWGTVTTIEGSFPSIRQKTKIEKTDTVWGLVNTGMSTMWVEFETDFNIDDDYSWFANGIGMPIVEVKYDTATNGAIKASWVLTTLTRNDNDDIVNGNSELPINIYPNPAQDFVYINAPKYTQAAASLYDCLGKLIETYEFNNYQQIAIPVQNLKNGVYMLDVNVDGNKTSHKFLKK